MEIMVAIKLLGMVIGALILLSVAWQMVWGVFRWVAKLFMRNIDQARDEL